MNNLNEEKADILIDNYLIESSKKILNDFGIKIKLEECKKEIQENYKLNLSDVKISIINFYYNIYTQSWEIKEINILDLLGNIDE